LDKRKSRSDALRSQAGRRILRTGTAEVRTGRILTPEALGKRLEELNGYPMEATPGLTVDPQVSLWERGFLLPSAHCRLWRLWWSPLFPERAMPENLLDHLRLMPLDERKDAHRGPTSGAEER
jgi:hypothetical protein